MASGVVDSEINNEYQGSDHCPLSLTFDLAKIYPIGNGPQDPSNVRPPVD